MPEQEKQDSSGLRLVRYSMRCRCLEPEVAEPCLLLVSGDRFVPFRQGYGRGADVQRDALLTIVHVFRPYYPIGQGKVPQLLERNALHTRCARQYRGVVESGRT